MQQDHDDYMIQSTGCCDEPEQREMTQINRHTGIGESPKQANTFLGIPLNEL